MPSLKLRTPLPKPFINSGIFLPPKNSRMTKPISRTSCIPIPPINKGIIILFADYVVNDKPTAYNLQQHARQADSEILDGGVERTAEGPFAQGSYDLVESHDPGKQSQGRFLESGGSITGTQDQKARFEEDGRKDVGCRHPEKEVVEQGRSQSRQKTHFPTILIGSDQGEEINGQETQPALGYQVAQLGQQDVASYESGGEEIGFGVGLSCPGLLPYPGRLESGSSGSLGGSFPEMLFPDKVPEMSVESPGGGLFSPSG